MAIDKRLNQLAHRQLREDIEGSSKQKGRPTGIRGGREEQGWGSSDERANIGHETHKRGEDAPHNGARYAGQPESQRDEDAVSGINQNLAQKIFAQARSGVVHG